MIEKQRKVQQCMNEQKRWINKIRWMNNNMNEQNY